MNNPQSRNHFAIAVGFEAALAVFALALAMVFGLTPWLELTPSTSIIALGVVATLPMLAAMLLMAKAPWIWARRLHQLVHDVVQTLFADSSRLAVLLVAVMAGLCEELLFRGVIQAGFAELFHPVGALLLASLLFGLAHAISKAYFVITTLVGIYLGWLYLWSGNLLLPMLVHFLYDWVALEYYLKTVRRQN